MHSTRLTLLSTRFAWAWTERKRCMAGGGKSSRGRSVLLLLLLFSAAGMCMLSSMSGTGLLARSRSSYYGSQEGVLQLSNCSCPQEEEEEEEQGEKKVGCEEEKKEVVKHEPWYAQGKTWHYPPQFPLCTMDACFNYTRCQEQQELLVFSYHQPSPPVRYFSGINTTVHHTADPAQACLFFVFLDTDNPWPPHPAELAHWNGGLNHVLVTFSDMWKQKGPMPGTIGFASILASDMHETIYRAGFDISIPLPGLVHMPGLQELKPWHRRYLMTFRGLRYLGHRGEGVLRSDPAFRNMHNGYDIVVATSCDHFINHLNREKDPELGLHCAEDEAIHAGYSYHELMNTTFGLVPAGVQPSSYRFIEVLSTGAIPVLIADNYVKPFETLLQWHRCILQFPSSQMHRIVPTIRLLQQEQLLRRQATCLRYYALLKDDHTLLATVMQALKARFYGVFHNQVGQDTVY